jgi:hypothetical protein
MDLDYFWLWWVANFDINLNNFIRYTVLKAQNKISKRTYIAWFSIWGPNVPPPQVFRNPKKCPFPDGKVPFVFVTNFVQIAFLTHGCCKATLVSLCGYLSVGQLIKQWQMTSMLGAHSLLVNRTFQNLKSGWSATNGKICTMLVCKKTANCFNSFCHFHLISSVSRPQRPLISIWLHLFFLPFCSISFTEDLI